MTIAATEGLSFPLAVAAAAVGVGWWALLGLLVVLRRPPRISAAGTDRGGLDVPAEPPGVAGLLANGFVVTSESAPAVLLDLAARGIVDLEEVQPGRTICRVHPIPSVDAGAPGTELADYELLVLDELRSKAIDGVVPTEALTTGPEAQSARWHRAFAAAITADAQRRGLTVPRWPSVLVRVLGLGITSIAVLLALAIWAGGEPRSIDPAGAAVGGGALAALLAGSAVLVRLRRSLAQLPTPSGKVAAADARALARRLRENDALADLPPAGVVLWDRVFAYAAAFGSATAAVALLPMGAEDDRRAWSRAGGKWRRVTVRYPRVWPPAWGKHPFLAIAVATFWGALAGVVLYGLRQLAGTDPPGGISQQTWDWVDRGALAAAIPAVVVLGWAVWVILRGVPDLRQSTSLAGIIVRDRRTRQVLSSGDEPDYWYYLAIDDGSRAAIRALRVRESLWRERAQGETVSAVVSPRLGYVRSISIE